uniref:Uncharacterized protein n=1 Tax=Plectus sambesii TaxID=2011161 RepID=A0A914VD48_9BILA
MRSLNRRHRRPAPSNGHLHSSVMVVVVGAGSPANSIARRIRAKRPAASGPADPLGLAFSHWKAVSCRAGTNEIESLQQASGRARWEADETHPSLLFPIPKLHPPSSQFATVAFHFVSLAFYFLISAFA